MQSDTLGMWLKLRQIKPEIPITLIQNHKTEIIEILGGIEKILDSILKTFGLLTFDSSMKLINLFNKITCEAKQKQEVKDQEKAKEKEENDDYEDEDEDEEEDEEEEESINIFHFSDDLISHICNFLNLEDLISFDKTCIYISRICHFPSSLYELNEYHYQKLSRSIDKKISFYTQSYSYYDKNILSDILNKLTEQIDVYRFTKLRKICIDTRLTAKIAEINDNPITPITQYFIFKNIINKLSHHPLDTLVISHFEVKNSSIFDDKDKQIIDLKDYFPTFLNVKKLRIPWSLHDDDEWKNRTQHFSFVFSHIYGVQKLHISDSETSDELYEYIHGNKNDFNVTDITWSPSTKQLKRYKKLNFESLKYGFHSFNEHLLVLCQETLCSLHLDFKLLASRIKKTDLSNITFIALKELCLRDFNKNCFVIDKNKKNNYFKAPNVEILTLYAVVFMHQFENNEIKPIHGSILDVLHIFDVKKLNILTFKGSFTENVTEMHGNETMLYWLNDINKCLNQKGIDIFRMNVDLEFTEKNLWDYKHYHLNELIKILNSFDKSNDFQSILIELKCVCTAKGYLYDIRDSALELGWNVDAEFSNWRYIHHAKMNGEKYTFRKGPVCHSFVKHPCYRCS